MRGAWWAAVALPIAALDGSAAFGEEPKSGDTLSGLRESDALAPEESPDSLLAQGIEFRKRRQDRLALAAFERAWAIGGSPRALAQVALAEQALGHWREAHQHLETALRHTSDPWISAHHQTLNVALTEISSRLGAVEVSCNVDGAEVRVDGRVVGRTPLLEPVRVAAGNSVIHVLADGYFDAARQAQIDANALARVDFTLTPLTQPLASTPDRSEPAPPAAELSARTSRLAPLGVLALGAPPVSTERTSARDVLTYTTVGLAALGATVGVTGYVMREVNVRLYNDDERCNSVMGTPRSVECGPEFRAWRRGEVIAIAGSAATGVFGLTALYLWWSEPDAHGDSTGLSCVVSPAAVTCGSVF